MKKFTIENPNYDTENGSGKLFRQMQAVSKM